MLPFDAQLGYPKERRLLKRRDFLQCYAQGTRYFSRHFIVFVRSRGERGHGLRCGATVSKKIGKAVKRNRVKRVLKEFFRLHQHEFPDTIDMVVVPKKHIQPARITYAQVEQELTRLLPRIIKDFKSTNEHV